MKAEEGGADDNWPSLCVFILNCFHQADRFRQKKKKEKKSNALKEARFKAGTSLLSLRVFTQPDDTDLQTPGWSLKSK